MRKIILFISLFIYGFSFGQETINFYIAPQLAGTYPTTAFADRKNKPSYVNRTTAHFYGKYGVKGILDFKKRFALEFGYESAEISWGLIFEENGVLGKENVWHFLRMKPNLHRYSLVFVKPLKLVSIKFKKHKDIKDLFFVNAKLGVSREFYSSVHTEIAPLPTDNRQFKYKNGIDSVNNQNFGIEMGLSTQFLRDGKRRIELGITYRKGLSKRLVINWATQLNNEPVDYFTTYSRGSFLGFYMLVPIKIFSIKK